MAALWYSNCTLLIRWVELDITLFFFKKRVWGNAFF